MTEIVFKWPGQSADLSPKSAFKPERPTNKQELNVAEYVKWENASLVDVHDFSQRIFNQGVKTFITIKINPYF